MSKKIGNLVHLSLLMCLVTLLPAQAEISVQARLSAASVTLRDTVTLTIEIRGTESSGIDGITLPKLQGLSVIGTSQSSQFSFVNGQVSHSKQFNYRLAPTTEGDIIIPSMTLMINGKDITTNQLTLHVGQNNATPPAAPMPHQPPALQQKHEQQQAARAMFLNASVSDSAPYAGEQIIYTVRFYRRIRTFGDITYYPPDMTGFTVFQGDEKQKTRSYRENIDGYEYQVDEINTVLVPGIATERLVIPKARVVIQMGFFEPARTIESQALPVQVRRLPGAAGKAFSGAVGEYTLKVKFDKAEVKVGEAINAVVEVAGEGNLNMVTLPDLPISEEIKRYDSKESADIKLVNNVLTGTKRAEIVLVPGVAGTYTFQPMSLTFFSPRKGKYVTVSASLPDITVRKSGSPAAAETDTGDHVVSQKPVQARTNDIVFIKDNLSLTTISVPYNKPWYPISLAAGVLLVVLNLTIHGIATVRQRKSGELQRKNSVRQSLSQIRRIRKRIGKSENAAVFSEIYTALLSAVALRFSKSPQGITRTEVRELCVKQGVPDEVIERMLSILDTCEMGRYGSAVSDTAGLAELCVNAEETLRALEKYLR